MNFSRARREVDDLVAVVGSRTRDGKQQWIVVADTPVEVGVALVAMLNFVAADVRHFDPKDRALAAALAVQLAGGGAMLPTEIRESGHSIAKPAPPLSEGEPPGE